MMGGRGGEEVCVMKVINDSVPLIHNSREQFRIYYVQNFH